MTESEAKLIESMADDYTNVLKEAKSMGCKEIRALYNIPLKNMELIIKALEKQKKIKEAFEKWRTESGGYIYADDDATELIRTLNQILRSDEATEIVKQGGVGKVVE